MKTANPLARSSFGYTRRLTAMMMAMIALGMACLGVYSVNQMKKNVDATAVEDLSKMGSLLAAQLGGAVRWKKPDAAQAILSFLLNDEASGLAALTIRDNEAAVLLEHNKGSFGSSELGDAVEDTADGGVARFSGQRLLMRYPISYKGERVGSLHLSWDMSEKHAFIVEKSWVMVLGSLMTTLFMGALATWMMARLKTTLGAEPRELAAVAEEVAKGNLKLDLTTQGKTPTGVYASMVKMHRDLEDRFNRERAEARSNSRLKQALDNVNANLMIADAEHRVIFANKAMSEFLDKRREKLEKHFPDFDPDKLVGTSMDVFHRDISSQRAAIEQARSTVSTELEFEDMVFIVSSDPVWSEDGERLGTAVSWRDLTAERAVEYELETIVNAAKSGDLTRRIETANKSDFHLVLSKAINELVDVSERVFADITRVFGALAEGELTQTIEADYQGVFGELKAHANATVGKLTQVIGQIKESAEQVNIGASELSQGNADLSRRTEQQGASLEETASSMEQMTGTVKRNAENAAQANELSTNTSLQAEGGGAVVDRAVAAMQEINASSQKINDIIGVIDEIAFQTNLLALNAAVEAARAGEQGRGFAVVAQEVRNLAQRSATAAKEIKALIEDSVSKVGTGSKLVDASGETLKEIVTSVKKVSEIVAEITAASQEQSIGIEQVSRAVCRMDEMTQQNAALVQEAAASSETMRNQAALMHDLVAFFKTDFMVSTPGESITASEVVERRRADRPWSSKVHRTPVVSAATGGANGTDGEWEEF